MLTSGGGRLFAARGKRLRCRPANQIGIDILVYNDGVGVGREQYAKLRVSISILNAKELRLIICNCQKENCYSHILHMCLCSHEVTHITITVYTIQYPLVLSVK